MKPIIERIKSSLPNQRKRWLTERKPDHHAAIRSLVDVGVGNEPNYISLKQDPDTEQYWIKHFIDEGMGHWFEYQPISNEQAQALKDNPDNLRDYVLHDWIEQR